ncbi:sugar-specific transcriptional regulator TrmB [Methanolobus halotolerans]|uniref:Sugar-specific transcriptional regulator TrmB n=1 Tax=Methanolobus halotolerans TaxID=2052935 RepID=A0A4E0PTI5_9EURY|nr:sugar-specific transcriptional regulator TrmB [Methanolobus halotolerans]TGC08053.1 sugar-specific transcriptional regulator TrmB [Methanolobus halotolerans]
MENLNGNSLEELLIWVISVDRRLVLLEAMKDHTIIKASDIAHETKRSTQNISRALKEFEDKDMIKCLTPEKATWKKYVLTSTGKEILKKMENEYYD